MISGSPEKRRCRTWGDERTARYMAALRDTMKGLLSGCAIGRERDDLRPGLQMTASGRHCIFFEADRSRVLVVRVLHERMNYLRHLEPDETERNRNR